MIIHGVKGWSACRSEGVKLKMRGHNFRLYLSSPRNSVFPRIVLLLLRQDHWAAAVSSWAGLDMGAGLLALLQNVRYLHAQVHLLGTGRGG
jgi:hypothetical protein